MPGALRRPCHRIPHASGGNVLRRPCQDIPQVPARPWRGEAVPREVCREQGPRTGDHGSGSPDPQCLEARAQPGAAPGAGERAGGEGGCHVRQGEGHRRRAEATGRRRSRALPCWLEHRRTRWTLAAGVPLRAEARRRRQVEGSDTPCAGGWVSHRAARQLLRGVHDFR